MVSRKRSTVNGQQATVSGVVPVLLAGGEGKRLFPLSRPERPKPYLSLAGEKTLLEMAYARARHLAPASRVFAVLPAKHRQIFAETLTAFPPRNAIAEPEARNTAAAVALASLELQEKFGEDAVLAFLPADHAVRDNARWRRAVIRAATEAARHGGIVLIGVKPAEESAAYGVIAAGTKGKIRRFIEKPGASTPSGLWNAGIFVFRAGGGLAALACHAPRVLAAARRFHESGDASAYRRLSSISFDKAVLERERNMRVVKGNFGWRDLGTWAAFAAFSREADAPET